MTWHVRIAADPPMMEHALYIWQEQGGVPLMLRLIDGGQQLVPFDPTTRVEPTLRLGRGSHEILAGLAQQLAQLGFGALETTPVLKVQEKHITSVELQAERLNKLLVTLTEKL